MTKYFDKKGFTFGTSFKRLEEKKKYTVYCKCGHSMAIYPMEHKTKKICSWCGYYVYKNKKVEFIDRLENLLSKNLEGVYQ